MINWTEWECERGHYKDCTTPYAPLGDCTGNCLSRMYLDEIEQMRKWEAFGRAILEDWPEAAGVGMDGFDLQDLGEKHGVLIGDEQKEPCGKDCNCAYEYGESEFPLTCYRILPAGTTKDSPECTCGSDDEVAIG